MKNQKGNAEQVRKNRLADREGPDRIRVFCQGERQCAVLYCQDIAAFESGDGETAVGIGHQGYMGFPCAMNEVTEGVIRRLFRIIHTEETGGRLEPEAVGEVPGRDGFDERMREKNGSSRKVREWGR